MDEQVVYKCLGVHSGEDDESGECCQAYRIVKRDGIDCGTCQKLVKEIWFRTDDDAKCSECFEQREIDRMMMQQFRRQVQEAK